MLKELMLTSLLLAAPVSAATLTASGGLNASVSRMQGGDTLLLPAGTYDESLQDVIPSGLSEGQRTVIRAAPGAQVIIRAPRGAEEVVRIDSRQYITLQGLILDGNHTTWNVLSLGGEPPAHHVRFVDCEMRNAALANGIIIGGKGHVTAHEFINVHLHHIGANCNEFARCHGIYIASDGNTWTGGSIHDTHAYGWHSYVAGGQPTRNTLSGARIYRTGGTGIGVFFGFGHRIYNNLVYNNGGPGIWIKSRASEIVHNTVMNNHGGGLLIEESRDIRVANNIVFGNSGEAIHDSSVSTQMDHNVLTDPRVANAAGGDFHLLAGSPAIDAGVSVGVAVDIDGGARGARVDIGAYEFGATGTGPKGLPVPRHLRVRRK